MSFIALANGRELDMKHPFMADVDALTIAWSLSQLNRFTGHAIRPYSVAEHSLLVCEILEREFGFQEHHHGAPALFAALMHDAHEAVASDMHSPGKVEIGRGWYEWENGWRRLVEERFNFHTAATAYRDSIHKADLMALATERRDLVCIQARPGASRPWPALEGIKPVDWVRLYTPERRNKDWEFWRDRWLDRFHELEHARSFITDERT